MSERQPVSIAIPVGYQKTLIDLIDCIAWELRGLVDPDQCEWLAFGITEAIRREFGGRLLYIGSGKQLKRNERNKAILRDFDGTNHRQLALRYGLSIQSIYDIIAKQRSMS